MKKLIAVLFLLLVPFSMHGATGNVTVATTINAVAGVIGSDSTALSCIGTPVTSTDSTSIMHMVCTVAGKTVHTSDNSVVVPGSVTISVQSGSNTITLLLTKGNSLPDQWQVSANGIVKTGSF